MPDEYAVPRDIWTERTLVGGIMAHGSVPTDLGLNEHDIYEPQLRTVFASCQHLTVKGQPCDPVTLRLEILRTGNRGQASDGVWLANLYSDGCIAGSLSHHAKALKALAVRRDVIETASRAIQSANNTAGDPWDTAAMLAVAAGAIADSGDPIQGPKVTDVHDFLTGTDDYDWLVPGLLERGDRLLITGGEGSGKSVLTRQIAVATAAGVNPFTGVRIEPARVLLIDLENGARLLRRHLRGLVSHAEMIGRPVAAGMLSTESRPSGIDLTRPEDRQWLRTICATFAPDLLVIGPLYRMHAADMNAEEPARVMTRCIDDIRAAQGCAVVMETHSPHGANGHVRTLRPVGSSLFMRWPEFGYGLRPKVDDESIMHLGSWRGPRDERQFPSSLVRGGEQEWPWAPYQGASRPFEGWAS